METIPWRRSRGGEAVEASPWRRPRGGAPAGLKIQIFLASRKHVKTLSNIVDFNRFSGPPRGGYVRVVWGCTMCVRGASDEAREA